MQLCYQYIQSDHISLPFARDKKRRSLDFYNSVVSLDLIAYRIRALSYQSGVAQGIFASVFGDSTFVKREYREVPAVGLDRHCFVKNYLHRVLSVGQLHADSLPPEVLNDG